MASITISNHFAKAFQNKTSFTKHTFWKTSFNMPVKNIFDNNTTYTVTDWMLDALGEDVNFDLSWFDAGWEIVWANTVFTLYWPFAGWNITLTQTWKNTLGGIMFVNSSTVAYPALASGTDWYSFQLVSNQWVASWEVNTAWTYQLVASTSWAFTSSSTYNVGFTNVPSVTTYTPWMCWIESNQFCWVSANWHIHKVTGTSVASPWATAGHVWIEWNYIYWIWTSGNKYRWQFNFQQFSSIFINWPSPWSVSGATAWMTWMDNNFWYEHIWYIASDWTKWIFNSWENPYA